jgi:hypothetical protein
MIEPPSDDEKLKAYLEQVTEWETKNVEPYDKAILTLASSALALSLTFTKDLVPPGTAHASCLLYAAWIFFVLAILTNVIGYILTFRSLRWQRRFAYDVYRHHKKTEKDFFVKHEHDREVLHWFNVFQGLFFVAGMVAFTAFIIINYEAQAKAPISHDGGVLLGYCLPLSSASHPV